MRSLRWLTVVCVLVVGGFSLACYEEDGSSRDTGSSSTVEDMVERDACYDQGLDDCIYGESFDPPSDSYHCEEGYRDGWCYCVEAGGEWCPY